MHSWDADPDISAIHSFIQYNMLCLGTTIYKDYTNTNKAYKACFQISVSCPIQPQHSFTLSHSFLQTLSNPFPLFYYLYFLLLDWVDY